MPDFTQSDEDVRHLPPIHSTPTLIAGRYRLLDKLGAGGMGEVYRAEQTEPVRRTVALKLIKAAQDFRAVTARFDAERQALALMDHPNIAKVFDGGATPEGHPFFVMELVDGKPITDFCDEQRLTARQRLELFVPVCEAIQHAHQKGIIHRDIKPSNVLVATLDGKLVPKVIDFGVAKATGEKLTADAELTRLGQAVGTWLYMSPEQAAGGPDVDTRTDVYGLGVLLYELLTGTTPIDRRRLKEAALDEIARIVRHEEPPRPSDRLSSHESKAEIAAARGGACPDRLKKSLRGEVDWIVMKALEKERDRRYESAVGLAKDVQRYLADEVVEARPPSRGYRARKFLRKHRGPVIAAGLVFAALVAGVVGTSIGFIKAKAAEADALKGWGEEAKQREKAEQQEKEAVNQKRQADEQREQAQVLQAVAKSNTDDAVAVTNFFRNNILTACRPEGEGGLGRDVTLRKAVTAAEAKVAGALRNQPLIEVAVRDTLSMTFRHLGETDLASQQLKRAHFILSRHLGSDSPEALDGLYELALLYLGQDEAEQAVPLLEDCLKRQTVALGPDHKDTLQSLQHLAQAYRATGDRRRAMLLIEDCLKRQSSKLGPDHPTTLASQIELGLACHTAGDYERSVLLLEDCLRRRTAKLGPDHTDTIRCKSCLALAYKAVENLNAAIILYEDCVKRQSATLGPGHPDTLNSIAELAGAYLKTSDARRAVPLLEDCVKRQSATLGPDHPETLDILDNLAKAYQVTGNPGRALQLWEDCLKQRTAKLGPDHPITLRSLSDLAKAHQDAGDLKLAVPLLEDCLKRRTAKLGPDHTDTLNNLFGLAMAYRKTGDAKRAVPLMEDCVRRQTDKLGPDDKSTLLSMNALASVCLESGDPKRAVVLWDDCLKRESAKHDPDHPDALGRMHDLAIACFYARDPRRAVALLEDCLKRRTTVLGPDHRNTLKTLTWVAIAHVECGEVSRAIPLLEDCLKRQSSVFGAEHRDTLYTAEALSHALEASGRKPEAVKLRNTIFPSQMRLYHSDSMEMSSVLSVRATESLGAGAFSDAELQARECLAIREKKDPEGWRTFSARSLVGESLLGQKKYATAEPLLVGGVEGMLRQEAAIPFIARPRLREAVERLIQLYESTDRPAEAAKWRAKLPPELAPAPRPVMR